MAHSFFDGAYVSYWKERVGNAADGSKVSDESVVSFFLQKLPLAKNSSVLDLGCGHGRLFPLLHEKSDHIEGADVTDEAVAECAKLPYKNVVKGSAENTTLPSNYFDAVVAWATYDVVEQEAALVEENRILKKGGYLLITGKNKGYEPTDDLAFIAERNAKLKDFPNHFTDVYGLIKESSLYGFSVRAGVGFPRRGDFGNLQFFDLQAEERPCYEFLLILEKEGAPAHERPLICYEYSDVAKEQAKEHQFDDVRQFFQWHAQNHG
ncbi:class I SAM-dependent methyltransferase [Candidatus Kaiserbacteria bacterium]|nr:class I SAM-dependent methyltransferase [Candidatus Kaiserbacteria bacterium]